MAVIADAAAVNLPIEASFNLGPRDRDYVGEVVGISLGAAGGVILLICIIGGILFCVLSGRCHTVTCRPLWAGCCSRRRRPENVQRWEQQRAQRKDRWRTRFFCVMDFLKFKRLFRENPPVEVEDKPEIALESVVVQWDPVSKPSVAYVR
ncbi:hypothetical protein BDV19DRAFT_392353 [Aspergillus venezuelensis]